MVDSKRAMRNSRSSPMAPDPPGATPAVRSIRSNGARSERRYRPASTTSAALATGTRIVMSAREAPQARAGARIEREEVHALSRGEAPEEKRRLELPFEGGPSRGRPAAGRIARRVEAVSRALHAMPSRVVDRRRTRHPAREARARRPRPARRSPPAASGAAAPRPRAAPSRAAPGDSVAEEEQRHEVHEQDQEQRDPQEQARLAAERTRDGVGPGGWRRGVSWRHRERR